jgi:predicted GNAT family N-acyltransferase
MGRLARDTKFKGAGLGELLLMHALRLALAHSRKVGSCAVVVDAKSQKAVEFYKSFGFIPLVGHSNRLFIPMRTIEEIFPET